MKGSGQSDGLLHTSGAATAVETFKVQKVVSRYMDKSSFDSIKISSIQSCDEIQQFSRKDFFPIRPQQAAQFSAISIYILCQDKNSSIELLKLRELQSYT